MADIVLILTLIFVAGLYIGYRIGEYDADKHHRKELEELKGGHYGR